jgi:hypothetical protein
LSSLIDYRADLSTGQQLSLLDLPTISAEAGEKTSVLFWGFDKDIFHSLKERKVLSCLDYWIITDSITAAGPEYAYRARIDPAAVFAKFQPEYVVILIDLDVEFIVMPMSRATGIYDRLIQHYRFSPSQIFVHHRFWGTPEHPQDAAYFEANQKIAGIPGGMFIQEQLYESIEYLCRANIPGDFAEFGVWKGRSLYYIAWLTKRLSTMSRQVLGFDTFAGFGDQEDHDHFMDSPFAGHSEYVKQGNDQKERIYADTSREAVAHLLTDFDNIELIEGDIRETIKTVEGRQLALAFFDMDDYSPTKAALKIAYDALQPGGVMIHDHFAVNTLLRGACYGQRVAMLEFLEEHPMFTLGNSNVFIKPPSSDA